MAATYLLQKPTVLMRDSLQSFHQCQLQGNLSKIYMKTETFRNVLFYIFDISLKVLVTNTYNEYTIIYKMDLMNLNIQI